MGLNYKAKNKDVDYDGHERADVRNYRDDFVGRMWGFSKFMQLYEDEDVEKEVEHPLFDSVIEFVWVTHDECCVWANDDAR